MVLPATNFFPPFLPLSTQTNVPINCEESKRQPLLCLLPFTHWNETPETWDSPTGGDSTCVSTLTSTTASMTVLLCRLDRAPMMALAAFWICPRSLSLDRPSCSNDCRESEDRKRWLCCLIFDGLKNTNKGVSHLRAEESPCWPVDFDTTTKDLQVMY